MPPGWCTAGLVGPEPDLKHSNWRVTLVTLRVADPGSGTHHLYVAGADCSDISLIVAVGEGSVVDITDYLNVRVVMQLKACVWRNLVIVQDNEIPHRFVGRIAIGSNGEMMSSPEPSSVRACDLIE